MSLIILSIIGLLAGQLLVWCADRLPAGRSLFDVVACPCCGQPLVEAGARRWPALLGWRRCADRGGKLRWRSLLLVIITAAGFPLIAALTGLNWATPAYLVYWLIFVLITIIDLEHRLILNVIILPAIILGLAGALITPQPGLARAALGGATGFILVYGIYLLGAAFARAMARRRGRPIDEVAFGAGDVKLAAFIGVVTGLPNVIFALVIGIFLGGMAAALFLGWQIVVRRRYVAFTPIPYGPFLAAGGLVVMLYGPQILRWYLSSYAR
jgi:leader peptidase (prepilin peptidase)/N-methyltransferase